MIDIAICAADKLENGGKGRRFPITAFGTDATGFVVRFQNEVVGYVNRCTHLPVELDGRKGEFFDASGMVLMSSITGALYWPDSGRCGGGPCFGKMLHKIHIFERQGQIFWTPDDCVRPVRA